jgi:Na+/proline symporter/nitrogen-specific signal transduction histidine kinase
MLPPSLLVAVALAYIGLLFVIAWRGDRRAAQGRSPLAHPWIYALSLAVYCTAWTFYGSVGRAAVDGYGFLPIYLGPTLGAALGWVVYRKILRIAKAERLTSVADFLASRYGKSASLGAVVAVVAVVGAVPYIALQLKAVVTSFRLLWNATHPEPLTFDAVSLVSAGLLAAFAILFGTRSLDLTVQHAGLVLAIAFESLVKLVAFLAVGVFVVYGLHDGFLDLFARAASDPALRSLLARDTGDGAWAWMTLISLLAFWLMPRQFQVGVVENVDERHLRTAAWLLPLYLLVINVFVLPIALAGRMSPATAGQAGDTFVLALPLAAGQPALAVLVFLGGLSAATGMVIVESLALSNMVANDLVLPVLLRRQGAAGGDLRRPLLVSRRLSIIVILSLGHVYAVVAGAGVSLVTIGLVSFAAAAQLAPATLGGLYWTGATRRGAFVGLISGFLIWGYTLPLPNLVASGLLAPSFLADGPFGIAALRPQALFGLSGLDPLTHSLVWSLLVNVVSFVGISSLGGQDAVEERQARRFVGIFRRQGEPEDPAWGADTPVASVQALLARFLGAERSEQALRGWAEERGLVLASMVYADPELIAFAERLLAGTTGAASARVALTSVAQEQALGVGAVFELLDETSRALASSRELGEKSRELEAASAELQRVNERLRELDRLKDDVLSTMAHELRTPLTAIRAFAEILHDNPGLDVAQRSEFLHIIAKENERLTRLINSLLDLAKLEADDEQNHFEPVDLAAAVDDAVAALGQLAAGRGVVVEHRRRGDLPAVNGDGDRLVQLAINLISNAIKVCPEVGGRVRVDVGRVGDELRLAVTDNGPGVPAAEREAIFEKFRQIEPPVSGQPRGTGLGLAISRRIAQQHEGSIWVEAAVGGGARFVVSLPVAPDAAAAGGGDP